MAMLTASSVFAGLTTSLSARALARTNRRSISGFSAMTRSCTSMPCPIGAMPKSANGMKWTGLPLPCWARTTRSSGEPMTTLMKLSTCPLTNTVLRVAGLVTWIFTLSAGILLIASSRSSIDLWSAVVATLLPIKSSGFLIGASACEMIAQAPS